MGGAVGTRRVAQQTCPSKYGAVYRTEPIPSWPGSSGRGPSGFVAPREEIWTQGQSSTQVQPTGGHPSISMDAQLAGGPTGEASKQDWEETVAQLQGRLIPSPAELREVGWDFVNGAIRNAGHRRLALQVRLAATAMDPRASDARSRDLAIA